MSGLLEDRKAQVYLQRKIQTLQTCLVALDPLQGVSSDLDLFHGTISGIWCAGDAQEIACND